MRARIPCINGQYTIINARCNGTSICSVRKTCFPSISYLEL